MKLYMTLVDTNYISLHLSAVAVLGEDYVHFPLFLSLC